MASVMEAATAERRDLLDFLRGLDEAQWQAPTLCAGWTVRDVVAHVIDYDPLRPLGLGKRAAQARLRLSKMNSMGISQSRDVSPAALLDAMEHSLRPRGLTTAFGGRVALTDCLIHHQDIRRPLGAPRSIGPERLRTVLDFSLFAPPIRGAWRARGVRMVATDLDWRFGIGPEARGTGETVLMAMAGRRVGAEELSGPGAERLLARLARQ